MCQQIVSNFSALSIFVSQVLTKGKLFEKNTTKCRKHQRNLIIRKYHILLDVKVCDRYVGTDIFCNIGFLFKIIEI